MPPSGAHGLFIDNDRDLPPLLGCDQSLEAVKHIAAQVITGKDGGRQDRRFGNPLVAGSSPACPTQADTLMCLLETRSAVAVGVARLTRATELPVDRRATSV